MTIFKSCKGEFEHTKEKRESSPELSQNIPKKYPTPTTPSQTNRLRY